jgi:hypothetical protein
VELTCGRFHSALEEVEQFLPCLGAAHRESLPVLFAFHGRFPLSSGIARPVLSVQQHRFFYLLRPERMQAWPDPLFREREKETACALAFFLICMQTCPKNGRKSVC